MPNKKHDWEVPDVDLNFRDYATRPSDSIKIIKKQIENFLLKPTTTEEQKVIYTAIFIALDYYKNILYDPSSDFKTGATFLNSTLKNMTKDYLHLAKIFNPPIPDDTDIEGLLNYEPVIRMTGRIKSPYSALEKIKDKVDEYLKNGSDFRYFNDSLRDFLGIRIVVTPPKYIRDQGPEAEREFLDQVLFELLKFHGFFPRDSRTYTVEDPYNILKINTRNHPVKLQEMQSDGNPDLIPSEYVAYVKNYVDHPKGSGYQSYHICVIPDYSDTIKIADLPPYISRIFQPTCEDFIFEYQLRTERMNEEAEHGKKTSHDIYKPMNSYSRAEIPFYIEWNDEKQKFRVLNIAESCQKHYGIVPFLRVYDQEGNFLTNTTFTNFRDRFTSLEREELISGKKHIVAYEDKGYEAEDNLGNPKFTITPNSPTPVILTKKEVARISQDASYSEQIIRESGVTDAIIGTTSTEKPKIQLLTVETPEERQYKITLPKSAIQSEPETSALEVAPTEKQEIQLSTVKKDGERQYQITIPESPIQSNKENNDSGTIPKVLVKRKVKKQTRNQPRFPDEK